MNTANLQLEGLYLAVAGLMDALKSKGVLSGNDIDAALGTVEGRVLADASRPELSPANSDAICFPIRLLRAANRAETADQSFARLAEFVGRTKRDR